MNALHKPTIEQVVNEWKEFRHLCELRRFRASGVTLEAGNDRLDKEINDIEADIAAQKKQSSGLGAGRSQALQKIFGFIITHLFPSGKRAI